MKCAAQPQTQQAGAGASCTCGTGSTAHPGRSLQEGEADGAALAIADVAKSVLAEERAASNRARKAGQRGVAAQSPGEKMGYRKGSEERGGATAATGHIRKLEGCWGDIGQIQRGADDLQSNIRRADVRPTGVDAGSREACPRSRVTVAAGQIGLQEPARRERLDSALARAVLGRLAHGQVGAGREPARNSSQQWQQHPAECLPRQTAGSSRGRSEGGEQAALTQGQVGVGQEPAPVRDEVSVV